jgi:hypothetical protein
MMQYVLIIWLSFPQLDFGIEPILECPIFDWRTKLGKIDPPAPPPLQQSISETINEQLLFLWRQKITNQNLNLKKLRKTL